MPVSSIKVDQVGYPLHGPKVALVSVPAKTFEIRRFGDGRVVFQGKMGPAQFDPDSGDTVEAADFSELHQAGEYYLQVPGVGRSWDFRVDGSVFEHAYYLAMRAFYGQRCGTAVDLGPEFPGYSHAACHLHGGFHPSSGVTGPRGQHYRRLARRGRLRTLHGELRRDHGNTAVDLGVVRGEDQAYSSSTSRRPETARPTF